MSLCVYRCRYTCTQRHLYRCSDTCIHRATPVCGCIQVSLRCVWVYTGVALCIQVSLHLYTLTHSVWARALTYIWVLLCMYVTWIYTHVLYIQTSMLWFYARLHPCWIYVHPCIQVSPRVWAEHWCLHVFSYIYVCSLYTDVYRNLGYDSMRAYLCALCRPWRIYVFSYVYVFSIHIHSYMLWFYARLSLCSIYVCLCTKVLLCVWAGHWRIYVFSCVYTYSLYTYLNLCYDSMRAYIYICVCVHRCRYVCARGSITSDRMR